jgi:hypothetical protein
VNCRRRSLQNRRNEIYLTLSYNDLTYRVCSALVFDSIFINQQIIPWSPVFVHNLLYIINILDIPTKKNNPLFSNVQMQILIEQVTFDDIMIMLVLYKTNMHGCYSITVIMI